MRGKRISASEKKKVLAAIRRLFREAENIFKKEPRLAERYVKLARRLAMKTRLRMPRELKRKFCKHCGAFLVPSVNCRIRLGKKQVIYYCLRCKHFMRYPYVREIEAKRREKFKKKPVS